MLFILSDVIIIRIQSFSSVLGFAYLPWILMIIAIMYVHSVYQACEFILSHHFQFLIFYLSHHFQIKNCYYYPILWRKKLRHRLVKRLPQAYTFDSCQRVFCLTVHACLFLTWKKKTRSQQLCHLTCCHFKLQLVSISTSLAFSEMSFILWLELFSFSSSPAWWCCCI